MKCYNHNDRDAVSTCLDCGKGLCSDCTAKYNPPICDQCQLTRISNYKTELIKNAVIMTVLFLFGLFSDGGSIVIALALAGMPWGWSFLNKLTPNVFLFMPIIGWVIYFSIKLALSMLIGIFVAPFQIYKLYNGFKQTQRLEQYSRSI